MKCLCCGKELLGSSSSEEIVNKWHNSCVKKFFGVTKFPEISIDDKILFEIAKDSVNKGLTIPGVQKKLSLYLKIDENPRLTIVNYPIGYILKPQTEEYKMLPECEYLVMQMAKVTKIKTVPFALIKLNKESDELAYITRRIDRVNVINGKEKGIYKLAMEDFCQLENRLTEDKYRGSYERCAKVIDKYSYSSGIDIADMFLRVVFSFVIGNSDMHLKNFSLIQKEYNTSNYILSEAYDMLPVNLVLPEDTDELALTLNGKNKKITRNDFIKFGLNIGLNEKSILKMINKIISLKDKYIELCIDSYLTDNMKNDFISLINNRVDRLNK